MSIGISVRTPRTFVFRYKPGRKFNGHITLIRAEQGAAREEDVGRDYGISQVSEDSDVSRKQSWFGSMAF